VRRLPIVRAEREVPRQERTPIGLPVDELPTPALLVDLEKASRNLALAAHRTRGRVALRPHVKTHKAVELARLQLEHGAVGVTAATVSEAGAMARGGIGSILIANEVVGVGKHEAAAELAGLTRLTVAIDDVRNARDLAAAAVAAGTRIGFLVEVDVGAGRCGVRSAAEAAAVAEAAGGLEGLAFDGVMGYEGHCVHEPDPAKRRRMAGAATARLVEAAESIRTAGIPVGTVSAGGTGTMAFTGAVAEVTELQIGSYVFLDTAYARIVPEFEVALTVLATVVSRRGTTVVLDCGTKAISGEHAAPELEGHEATVRYLAEEHAVFDVDRTCALDLGDRVRVRTGHCCATTNLHAVHHVVVEGVVTEVWPIARH
jgi:D-serine deaminase-like pyridoxal phosphate-dependent protein